jgi:hypothetical protein
MRDDGIMIINFYWTKHPRVGGTMMKKTPAALMVGLSVYIAFLVPFIMGTVWANATQPAVGTANSAEELFSQMLDAEYAIYEEAEQAALEVRLQTYKYYMDQKFDATFATSTPHLKIMHRIAELYGRLLMLRVETIIETKRQWPDHPVADQIDMLTYQPQLIIDIMQTIDWLITLEELGLNWDQQKAVLANWHRRDTGRMEKNYQTNLRLIDIKETLSKETPDSSWVKESIDAIVTLHIEMFNDYNLNYKKTWELLSPEQRAKLLRLVIVAVRSK